MDWTKFYDERPTDPAKRYAWRVSPRLILGLELQPVWCDKLHLCGVGYKNELWPPYSYWDGYKRTVDSTLEWREAEVGEPDVTWHGLDLLPCPFSGQAPEITGSPRWMGAPPYMSDKLWLKSKALDFGFWRDAKVMQERWNTRATT